MLKKGIGGVAVEETGLTYTTEKGKGLFGVWRGKKNHHKLVTSDMKQVGSQ